MLTSDDAINIPKLKDFQFERKLGAGTYATVYKAINKAKNNEVCAIKCIKRSSLNEISTENLLREIEILKNVRNEYIVQLKDFQWNENYIYLIMEYCSGGDLSNFIRSRRTIPEKYVRRFLQQIACALKHLHSLSIAHMDLKPSNILLTSVNNPSLKLGDFGFAQKLKENSVGSSLRGSPLYMAPEIIKFRVYDAKVDLWSVGVILYEVIFGYAPFVSSSFEELEKKILDDKPIEIPSNVMLSETCKDLLKRLLQRNPQDRISFEQFFNHPFIDLEHMPDATSYNKAKMLFDKAIKADERNDQFFAQKCYLHGLEHLVPAIQYEKDHNRKQEMRAQAKNVLKRAEELANRNTKNDVNSPSRLKSATLPDNKSVASNSRKSQDNAANGLVKINSSNNLTSLTPSTPSTLSVRPVSANQSQIVETLIKLCSENEKVKYAIQLCSQSDNRLKDDFYEEKTLKDYQLAIEVLLPYVQTLPKESEVYSLLKKQIDRWLSNAESLKERIQLKNKINEMEMRQAEQSFKDDDDNSPYIKGCILQ